MEGLKQQAKLEKKITSKEPESGRNGYADFEISGDFNGVEVNFLIKDVAEGDKEVVSVFNEALKSAIENGGQEMFRMTKESNNEDFVRYLSAKPIADYMKYLFNPEMLKNMPMSLKIKDKFGTETHEEIN